MQPHSFPKITVVTPSFNQGKYIRETIESVLSQHYPNLEYIIIDGGSEDETVSVIKEYDSQITHWVSEPDYGQSHAINKGFATATGDILCWLNSDDQFAPNALLSVALAFITSSADIVAGICEVYEDGELVHRHLTSCNNDQPLPLHEMLDLDNGWNGGQFFYQPEVFFSKRLWNKAGSHVREDCYYSMDYELWCRFALNAANLHIIGAPLVHFRQHADQKTADPTKFKKELIEVRDRFCVENDIDFLESKRPEVNWSKKLRVALVNNLGFLYGAGIAQKRIAGAFELAGHEVECFSLLDVAYSPVDHVLKAVKDFKPNIIIFGNLHDNGTVPTSLISELAKNYYCYWVTHDFWLITGRCGYFGSCNKYLSGCDADCPTSNEYPVLASEEIGTAWQTKKNIVRESSKLTILANSNWSATIHSNIAKKTINTIRLGVPSHQYKPLDKKTSRQSLGIEDNAFVLFFSVSSLSDPRKGGEVLRRALSLLSITQLTLVVVGRLDVPLDVEAKIVSLGYVEEVSILVEAMNASDLYIGPSLEETFGQVFMEAAMCGLPSVGFDVSGVKDSIKEGITGFKVKEITPEALAAEVQSLYDNPARLLSVRKLARIYAVNEFSIERSYASFFQVLNEQGLVDVFGIPHKSSFKESSAIIDNVKQGWRDLSWGEKTIHFSKKAAVSCINLLPVKVRAKIVQLLPEWLNKFLIKVLYQ